MPAPVEPSFVLGGINPYNQRVLLSVAQVMGDIVGCAHVTTFVITEIEAVDPAGSVRGRCRRTGFGN